MMIAIICANDFCESMSKAKVYECVVTSGLDSKHGNASLHNMGFALDFRTRDMGDSMVQMYVAYLKDALGPQYDVILESNHIHVEFQPKYNPNFHGG